MKLVDMTCPHCGAKLRFDSDNKNATCKFCGASLLLDDEVQHIQYDNAEEAGYQFEKGRQRAQIESAINLHQKTTPPPKKQRTWLWVLGWIFVFPLPLTIILLSKEKMKMVPKIIIIVVAWLVYLLIGLAGMGGSSDSSSSKDKTPISEIPVNETSRKETIEDTTQEQDTTSGDSTENAISADDLYSLIADFIGQYNAVADNKISTTTNYNIHEEHYRTEYRLPAFDDSVGTFGEATDSSFEIVASKPGLISSGGLTYHNLRIYGGFNDIDAAKEALETIIPIIDPSITVQMIQDEYSSVISDVNSIITGDSGVVSFYIQGAPRGSNYKIELFID